MLLSYIILGFFQIIGILLLLFLLFSSSGDFFSSLIHRVLDVFFASNFTSERFFGKTGRENGFVVFVWFDILAYCIF